MKLGMASAHLVDGDSRLKVVNAAEHEIDALAVLAALAEPVEEVRPVVDGRDVIRVRFKIDVGVDVPQGLLGRGRFRHARLVGAEEQPGVVEERKDMN